MRVHKRLGDQQGRGANSMFFFSFARGGLFGEELARSLTCSIDGVFYAIDGAMTSSSAWMECCDKSAIVSSKSCRKVLDYGRGLE